MKKTPTPKGPELPKGTTALILRPHLWSGCVGIVERCELGLHRMKITAPSGAVFRTDTSGEYLRIWPWKLAPIPESAQAPARLSTASLEHAVYRGNE